MSDAQETPEQLLQLVATRGQSDREANRAFARLDHHYRRRLKAFILRCGSNPSEAEDRVQEALCAVWKSVAQFDPSRGSADSWVYKIAMNKWLDHTRRQRAGNATFHTDDLAVAGAVPPGTRTKSPEAHLQDRQITHLVRGAIQSLSPDQRRVVHMTYIDKLPQAKIADITQAPLGTVKGRVRWGEEHLRKALHPHAVSFGLAEPVAASPAPPPHPGKRTYRRALTAA
jgi:RNA polymerase sigma-70 factor, ECF subfamily